ncbi:BON domain-containing protein [Dyella amyloliquefaciens]|uniref:BON domain-containing protein n=1 Tax=Dyella amyloliquefaciens TaxID=1770545 RepID=UPI00102E4FCB|nr:BON domain-containing protein [Dyella amyloliquefaciens]
MRPLFTLSSLALAGLLLLGSTMDRQQVAYAQPQDASHSSSSQPTTDTWITTKVKAELASTDGVKSGDISVTTLNGQVTLTGVVASDVVAKKAVAAARSVKGVTSVDSSGLKTGS